MQVLSDTLIRSTTSAFRRERGIVVLEYTRCPDVVWHVQVWSSISTRCVKTNSEKSKPCLLDLCKHGWKKVQLLRLGRGGSGRRA